MTPFGNQAQVEELVELTPLKKSLVGLPGISGLSVEQRKRLTIAVELVANPSVIFMDEPTSGAHSSSHAVRYHSVTKQARCAQLEFHF